MTLRTVDLSALRSSATRDRNGRPGTARAICAVDYGVAGSLRALLSEALRELGNAVAADADLRDDGEGVGVPHQVLRAEQAAPIGLLAE